MKMCLKFKQSIFAFLFLIPGIILGQLQSPEEYMRAFRERQREVIFKYDTSGSPGIYSAAIRYAEGREIEKADSIFLASSELRHPQGDMFWMYPVIGTYLHGLGKMSKEVREAVRTGWKEYSPYRGDTENHWCMYYTSLFLAAEQFPKLPGSEWFNRRSSNENLIEAKEYLKEWMKITTTIGQGEFDSPNYFPEFIVPMLLLAQFALDPDMKLRGEMMADYLLADFAVDHLDGMYLGGFSREAATAVTKPWTEAASDFAWLYFGTGPPKQSGWIVFGAISDYKLPYIIYQIANDRTKPYVNLERKRVRNVIRYGKEKNPPVYKYSYVTKDYGLSSLQGGILQPIQQLTWSVRFPYLKPTSTIFGLHPYWSGHELAMFFPEEEKILISDVAKSKGTYNQDNKWTSSSPYERTFQNKNTLMVLYNIPPGTTSEHIDGFFPKNLEELNIDSSGWLMCNAKDTYIGWFPLQEYQWLKLDEDDGNSRLRSHKLQNGYIVEVRSKSEIGSFKDFCKKLRTHLPKSKLTPLDLSVVYKTLEGEIMQFRFPDSRKLNGKLINFPESKLFYSPFTRSQTGSEKLLIQYKGKKLILDFKKVKKSEE
jgi:hypothetical protein